MAKPYPADHAVFYGPFRPMRFEADIDDCIVAQGEIPKDIAGGAYRIGATWKRTCRQGTHGLYSLDSMVQSMIFEDGKARFRNRWLKTPKFLLEQKHGRGMFEWTDGHWNDLRNFCIGDVQRDAWNAGVPQGNNAINIFPFAGKMIAVGEQGGPPIAVDPMTLETVGIVPWSIGLSPGVHKDPGKPNAHTRDIVPEGVNVHCAFTAHPKWDVHTGDVWGWSFSHKEPYITAYCVRPDGRVDKLAAHHLPYAADAHDGWLTQDYLAIPIHPWLLNPDRIVEGHSAYDWKPEMPMGLLLFPRKGFPNVQPRFMQLDIPAECVVHTLAANTQGNILTLDSPAFEGRPAWPFESDFLANPENAKLFFALASASMTRWTIDLTTGRSKTERLSDRPCELSKIDERFFGKPYRWGFLVGGERKRGGMYMKDLVKFDAHTGSETVYRIQKDRPCAILEPNFVPRRTDAPEGDGWVIVPVTYWADNRCEYQIFDADDITVGPVATIDIPFHCGWSAHGHWMDFRT
jgi:carotenoid cleavage dioxygenase-like enzyme